MVAQIMKKQKAKFRIIIRELATGKSKTLSLSDSTSKLEDVERKVIDAFTPKSRI